MFQRGCMMRAGRWLSIRRLLLVLEGRLCLRLCLLFLGIPIRVVQVKRLDRLRHEIGDDLTSALHQRLCCRCHTVRGWPTVC